MSKVKTNKEKEKDIDVAVAEPIAVVELTNGSERPRLITREEVIKLLFVPGHTLDHGLMNLLNHLFDGRIDVSQIKAVSGQSGTTWALLQTELLSRARANKYSVGAANPIVIKKQGI